MISGTFEPTRRDPPYTWRQDFLVGVDFVVHRLGRVDKHHVRLAGSMELRGDCVASIVEEDDVKSL